MDMAVDGLRRPGDHRIHKRTDLLRRRPVVSGATPHLAYGDRLFVAGYEAVDVGSAGN